MPLYYVSVNENGIVISAQVRNEDAGESFSENNETWLKVSHKPFIGGTFFPGPPAYVEPPPPPPVPQDYLDWLLAQDGPEYQEEYDRLTGAS